MLKRMVRGAMNAVFPPNIYCIACGSVIDGSRSYSLCDSCVEKFRWVGEKTCEKCGKILENRYHHRLCYDCRRLEHSFDKGFTCARYSLYERSVMMDYKYRSKSYIGKLLGDILYDRMRGEDITVDWIVPVPIHSSRLRARGYNQAEIMALRLGERWEVPVKRNLLIRNRPTTAMKGLSTYERRENVAEAFSFFSDKEATIAGRNILLVEMISYILIQSNDCKHSRITFNFKGFTRRRRKGCPGIAA
jgi:competence protein ComFC